MRYSKKHKEETRGRIINAALRKFRTEGYYGIGVDGVAKAAGVTSGAFYGHFSSKAEIFRHVAVEGLSQLRQAIEASRDSDREHWVESFTSWYLSPSSERHTADDEGPLLPVQGGCALPCLTPEVARADDNTKTQYQQELLRIIDEIVAGLPEETEQQRTEAWAMMALLAGGISLARSVSDDTIAEEISQAILATLDKVRSH